MVVSPFKGWLVFAAALDTLVSFVAFLVVERRGYAAVALFISLLLLIGALRGRRGFAWALLFWSTLGAVFQIIPPFEPARVVWVSVPLAVSALCTGYYLARSRVRSG